MTKFLDHKKIFSSLAITASLICVSLTSIQALSNSDIWLWLKTGELIAKTREFPTKDFLSHTAQGREWIAHAWGFGILTFTIYQHLGELGLAAFRLITALLVFFTLQKTMRILIEPSPKKWGQAPRDQVPGTTSKLGHPPSDLGELSGREAFFDTLFAVTICFAFSVIANAWIARPHLLGALYISVLMLILAFYRLGKTTPIYAVPLLTIIWANTHASLPIAFALMLLLLGSEILEKLLRTKNGKGTVADFDLQFPDHAVNVATSNGAISARRGAFLSANSRLPAAVAAGDWRAGKFTIPKEPFNFKLLATIILISFLTSLINPYHLKIYQYFFKINSLVKENILEWLPLSFFFGWSQIKGFLIFTAIAAITLVLVPIATPRKTSYFEAGLTLISGYLALSALRHIVIAVIILTPILTKNAGILLERLKISSGGNRPLLSLLLLTTIAILASGPGKRVVRGEWGISPGLLSTEAIDFIKKTQPQGNMYNHFNFGSTLLWHLYPQYQTFIDGRVDMFVPDIYQEWLAVGTGKEGWEKILEKYNVGWIIFKTQIVWPDLRESLKKENTWCLVFWDDTASIILKREKNEALCRKYGYNIVNPWDPNPPRKEEITKELKDECQRALESSSWNVGARNKLGVIYAVEGKIEEAKEQFKIAIETGPPYPITYLNLADLYMKQEPQKAIAILKQAIKENPAAGVEHVVGCCNSDLCSIAGNACDVTCTVCSIQLGLIPYR